MEPLDQYYKEGEELLVHVVPQRYDEKAARLHVKRTLEVLQNPCILVSQQKDKEEPQPKQEEEKKEEPKKEEGKEEEKKEEQAKPELNPE